MRKAKYAYRAAGLCLLMGLAGGAFAQDVKLGPSGQPIPRFVSLKSDSVNVRQGPSRDQAVVWRYVRSGMPVEITQEFENWRRIRDVEGAEGWVFHSLLSGTRTALVAPWDTKKTPIDIHSSADDGSRVTAHLEPGVQGRVNKCDGSWCQLSGDGFSGWIHQQQLWGVYPDEKF
ncbi:SH3 domain-containing protein [Oryzibacter oryziterrae]|uniref:SH3 domain-containing protein n=1 Tax=Oryzibacter oryziterrae TaxID=2766474 RepID=UPI001EFF4478|nr:SH3 domain-containing protein [Oryzibacter oryziterrae]